MYFVTVDRQGTTVFTSDYQQHLVNVELARANGVLDSVAKPSISNLYTARFAVAPPRKSP
jgi:hypothetical protein